ASTLSIAAGGRTLPSLPVVQGFVRACRGDVEEWTKRWHELAESLDEPAPVAEEALDSGWERVRRSSRDESEPGDLVLTSLVQPERAPTPAPEPSREPAGHLPLPA